MTMHSWHLDCLCKPLLLDLSSFISGSVVFTIVWALPFLIDLIQLPWVGMCQIVARNKVAVGMNRILG